MTMDALEEYFKLPDSKRILTRLVAVVVDNMKGIDRNDMTSWDSSNINLFKSLDSNVSGKKLCYIKELCDISNYPNADEELKLHLENFNKTLEICKNLGMEVEEVSVDRKLLNAIYSTYVVIHSAEASSNMSNLTGIIFGPRGKGENYIEMIKDHRTNGFSPLIKRRFVIGSYVLQKENKERYFNNAQRARRLLVDTWKDLFKKYDAVLNPVGIGPAKKFEDLDIKYDDNTIALDEHLQIGNFGGFPSISIPDGFVNNLPVSICITGNCYDDENVLNIAYALESAMDYKGQVVKEVK